MQLRADFRKRRNNFVQRWHPPICPHQRAERHTGFFGDVLQERYMPDFVLQHFSALRPRQRVAEDNGYPAFGADRYRALKRADNAGLSRVGGHCNRSRREPHSAKQRFGVRAFASALLRSLLGCSLRGLSVGFAVGRETATKTLAVYGLHRG